MTDRELLQEALDALDLVAAYGSPNTQCAKAGYFARQAIRDRLEKPEQEQTGCGKTFTENKWAFVCGKTEMNELINLCPECHAASNKENVIRELQGRIGAMKEMLQPEQKPVAWWNGLKEIPSGSGPWPSFNVVPDEYLMIPLYEAPQQRQPLTDEQICEFADCYAVDAVGYDRCIAFTRAVEAAHNIKETK